MNGPIRCFALGMFAALTLVGCGSDDADVEGITGDVVIDGSSTVLPITEAVAEVFMDENGDAVRVTVASSGTGGGFKRFCAGEIDISDASRPISATEQAACAAAQIEYVELEIALDGLAMVTNPANTFAQCLTVDELRRIWAPGSRVKNWSEVRPAFPNQELRLYGPGTNSGTFDYFTETINGEAGASRPDYTASEDDNVLVQGVAGDLNSLGYFGYAYYAENQSRVKLVAVDNGAGCITPSPETVENGTYAPLSRPLFIYVKRESLTRPAVRAFVEFYLNAVPELSAEVGYMPLKAEQYDAGRTAVAAVPDA